MRNFSFKISSGVRSRNSSRARRGRRRRTRHGLAACRPATPRQKPLDPRNRCRVMQWLRAGDPCAEHCLLRVERFGIRFVASPAHADVLLVTGPVTKNMRDALERPIMRPPTRNGHCPRRLRTRWRVFCRQLRGGRRGLADRFPSIFIFAAVRHRPLRFAGTIFPTRSTRQKAPLPLEALETTSAIPGRLDRGVCSSRNSLYDTRRWRSFLHNIGIMIPAYPIATRRSH